VATNADVATRIMFFPMGESRWDAQVREGVAC
jgi:hypothetical protein